MPGNSVLFIFCDHWFIADLSVPYISMYTKQPFYLTQILFLLLHRGPSHVKYIKVVTTEIQKTHVGMYK